MDCRDTETLSKQETDDPDIGHKPRWSFLSVSASLRLIGLSVALATVGCGVPNLEKPQCTAARESVKHFYSVHVGNDMRPSNEYLKVREPFLTSELLKNISATTETPVDYFTKTENYPRAFRVALCTSDSVDKTSFQIQLLWRDETASSQQNVQAEAVLTGDKWLINKVSN